MFKPVWFGWVSAALARVLVRKRHKMVSDQSSWRNFSIKE